VVRLQFFATAFAISMQAAAVRMNCKDDWTISSSICLAFKRLAFKFWSDTSPNPFRKIYPIVVAVFKLAKID
jgi:hypothetical protein